MEKKVIELFAGVGGFRVGLNNVTLKDNVVNENSKWNFIWANQWEPSTKAQPAFECYTKRFGNSENHINEDIAQIDVKDIPEHVLLVGGFPCQDYSVARPLSKGKGIQGKKGVLWWEIYRIIKHHKTPFLLLENVDRLLKSPAKQRGRDFGIMLKSLLDLGYSVQWRVINAAEYGCVQRRRRVFIFAYLNSTKYYSSVRELSDQLYYDGIFAKSFPVQDALYKNRMKKIRLPEKDLIDYTNSFSNVFYNTGIMHNGDILTLETLPVIEPHTPLKQILEYDKQEKYYLSKEQIEKHMYLKGAKKVPRKKPNGEEYFYSEGSMEFPDDINKPGRTMLTSEGTINRSSHIVPDIETGEIRKITPKEAERLNGFPDDWTNTGMSERQRYFMMGNALVVDLIKKLEPEISKIILKE